jgi:hypothetical protein
MGSRRLAIVLLLGVAVALGAGLFAGRLLAQPEPTPTATWEPAAGLRFQQALAELAMRAASASPRSDPVVVTAGELNAFLARHVESRRLPFRPLVVAPGEDRLVVAGRTSPAQLADRSWIGPLLGVLPRGARELDLWVSVRGRLVVRAGEAEFEVEETRVGRQRVPVGWVWSALDVDPREQLHWRMPRVVERIEARPGRLLIHTRPQGGRGGPA